MEEPAEPCCVGREGVSWSVRRVRADELAEPTTGEPQSNNINAAAETDRKGQGELCQLRLSLSGASWRTDGCQTRAVVTPQLCVCHASHVSSY